jgi:small conductance mechanosensitive channel
MVAVIGTVRAVVDIDRLATSWTWHGIGHATLHGLERVGAAAAVLVCGVLIALFVRAVLRRWLRRHEGTLGPSVARLPGRWAFYTIVVLAAGLALIVLGVPATLVSTAIVVILVIFVVALRESIADLAATVIFLTFGPFKRGDLIETAGYVGTVEDIFLLTTVLRLQDRRVVTLPNGKIQSTGIVNYTRAGVVLTQVRFAVPYSVDLDQVRALVREVAGGISAILDSPDTNVVVEELSTAGPRLLVLAAVRPVDFWSVAPHLRERIKAEFDAHGIPFSVVPFDTDSLRS